VSVLIALVVSATLYVFIMRDRIIQAIAQAVSELTPKPGLPADGVPFPDMGSELASLLQYESDLQGRFDTDQAHLDRHPRTEEPGLTAVDRRKMVAARRVPTTRAFAIGLTAAALLSWGLVWAVPAWLNWHLGLVTVRGCNANGVCWGVPHTAPLVLVVIAIAISVQAFIVIVGLVLQSIYRRPTQTMTAWNDWRQNDTLRATYMARQGRVQTELTLVARKLAATVRAYRMLTEED
jgi:hypothetical protein